METIKFFAQAFMTMYATFHLFFKKKKEKIVATNYLRNSNNP